MLLRKAEMGIGTLIIFIAMILVAAIAAGVLIQTATSLQNRALLVGQRSQDDVSSSISPIIIYGEDGSTGHDVEMFTSKIKLNAGSEPMKFDEIFIELALSNDSNDLMYFDGGIACNETNGTSYNVTYLIEGNNYDNGYLQRGDVVSICFESTRGVGEDEAVRISMIPKTGHPTIIETAMPDIITEQRVMIFP